MKPELFTPEQRAEISAMITEALAPANLQIAERMETLRVLRKAYDTPINLEDEREKMLAGGIDPVNVEDWYQRAFRDYRKVFVLTDGDTAGRELGNRIAKQIDVAVIAPMPDGLDVNEFVLQYGADELRKRVGL